MAKISEKLGPDGEIIPPAQPEIQSPGQSEFKKSSERFVADTNFVAAEQEALKKPEAIKELDRATGESSELVNPGSASSPDAMQLFEALSDGQVYKQEKKGEGSPSALADEITRRMLGL